MLALAASLLILASEATGTNAAWRAVMDTLVTKHASTHHQPVIRTVPCVTNALDVLRAEHPRYLAFVMRPEELDESVIRALHVMVREIDADPFDDAIWGVVTGPTARDAKRIAASREPLEFKAALSTTGMDVNLVPGPVTVLIDGNPPGVWKAKDASGKVTEHQEDGDVSHAFVFGWNDEPNLILTSSHATETNLEMPFSRGMIVPRDGRFVATCGLPMREPKRAKVWIAAGNCLIGSPRPTSNLQPSTSNLSSMVMTALGWGQCNQFFGYTVETWFGEIGWNTWRYFNAYRMPLTHCWYAANQNLVRTLAGAKPGTRERRGKEWDMDGTAFYGDPMQFIALPPLEALPKWTPDALPRLVVFDGADPSDRPTFPAEWEVFMADDFALILRW